MIHGIYSIDVDSNSLKFWPLFTVIFLSLIEKIGMGIGDMDKRVVRTGLAFASYREPFPDPIGTEKVRKAPMMPVSYSQHVAHCP